MPIEVNQLLDAVIPVALPYHPNEFFVDVLQFPPAWQARIAENNLGGAPIDAPVFLVQGCADTTIPITTNFAYFEQTLCPQSETVEFRTYARESHSGVVVAAFPDIIAWANARLAGDPAPSNCGTPPSCR